MTAFDGGRRYERFGHALLPAVLSRAWLAACHAELGTFAEGRALGEEGLQIAEAVDHPGSLTFASWGIGLLSLRQGDLARALPLLERALDLCREADLTMYFPWMATALGMAYTLSGRVADAVSLLTQAMEQSIATETVGYQAFCSLSLGEAYVLAGRLEEAHALTERALGLARAHQERGYEAYALRLLGDIAARCDPPESALAAAHYQQALTLAEELDMRPLQAHCHRGLGVLYVKRGQATAGTRGTHDCHEPVPSYGYDLLAAPGGGSPDAGGGMRKRGGKASNSPALACKGRAKSLSLTRLRGTSPLLHRHQCAR